MTDDRNSATGPPPEPPAPPPPPDPAPPPLAAPPPPAPAAAPPATPPAPQPTSVYVAPARPTPWGWIVAAILALVLLVLVILYFTGTFDREQRPPVGPVSGPAPAHAPTTGGSTGNPGTPAPAPAPAGGQVTEQWLLGGWGQDCPTVNDPQLTFQPGGRFLLGSDPGDWLLQDNVITIRRDGQGNTSSMRWDYLGPDSALVTRLSTGDTYTVYRCG